MAEFYNGITPTTISTDYKQSNEENTKAPAMETELYNEFQQYFTNWREVYSSIETNMNIVIEINQALRLAQMRVYRNYNIYPQYVNQWVTISGVLPRRYAPPRSMKQLAYNTDTFVEINLGAKLGDNVYLKCKSATSGTKPLRCVFFYHYNALDKPEPEPDTPDEPTE